MSHVYQPVMIRTLLKVGASALPQFQPEEYTHIGKFGHLLSQPAPDGGRASSAMNEVDLVRHVLDMCEEKRLRDKLAHPQHGIAAVRRLRLLVEKLLKGRVLRGNDVASLWRDFTEWDASLPADPPPTLSISQQTLSVLNADADWADELKRLRNRLSQMVVTERKRREKQGGRSSAGGAEVAGRWAEGDVEVTRRSLQPTEIKEPLATDIERDKEKDSESHLSEKSSTGKRKSASPLPKASPPSKKDPDPFDVEGLTASLLEQFRPPDKNLGLDFFGNLDRASETEADVEIDSEERQIEDDISIDRTQEPKVGPVSIPLTGAAPHPLAGVTSVSLSVFDNRQNRKTERNYSIRAGRESYYVKEKDMRSLLGIERPAEKAAPQLLPHITEWFQKMQDVLEPERGPAPKVFGMLTDRQGAEIPALLFIWENIAQVVTPDRTFSGEIKWIASPSSGHPIGKAVLTSAAAD